MGSISVKGDEFAIGRSPFLPTRHGSSRQGFTMGAVAVDVVDVRQGEKSQAQEPAKILFIFHLYNFSHFQSSYRPSRYKERTVHTTYTPSHHHFTPQPPSVISVPSCRFLRLQIFPAVPLLKFKISYGRKIL
jgi:hypothetical protein